MAGVADEVTEELSDANCVDRGRQREGLVVHQGLSLDTVQADLGDWPRYGAKGAVTPDTIKLFAIGLPVLIAGTWLGMKLYGRLDEASFRKVVLVLLFVSGVALML